MQQAKQENAQLTEELEIVRAEMGTLGSEMLLSKRKIELRERYYNEKEKAIVDREARLSEAEEQVQRDREEVLARLDESSLLNAL